MASGQFFDPMALLRAAPLVTSSMSLWYCVDQYMFFDRMSSPELRDIGTKLLPGFWRTFLNRGLACIFSLYLSSAAAGLTNSRVGPEALAATGAGPWYVAGGLLSLGHFVFVPAVTGKIRAMVEADDDAKGGQAWVWQRRWLRVHAIRSCTVDLAGWACFVVAVMKGLKGA